MRYVPGLIPQRSKVLPGYFNGDIYAAAKLEPVIALLQWALGLLFLFIALRFSGHFSLFCLLAVNGLVLIPPGRRFTERKLRFRLTSRIRSAATLIMMCATIPLGIYYSGIDQQEAQHQQLLAQQKKEQQAREAAAERRRQDSLDYYISQSNKFKTEHQLTAAGNELQHAALFATTEADRERIKTEEAELSATTAIDLVRSGKYSAAIPELGRLLNAHPGNTDLKYYRAICYSKSGNIQAAVEDLKPLIEAGNEDASKLNDKINPVRKHVIGYETLCCDGTTSDARGRGACSHHGGVCDWNHPIYEEYRKYK